VLTLPDGTPFSTVIEKYTDDVLAFPEPRLQGPKCTENLPDGI
jgi:ketosteroid isomerase-like protein